MPREIRTEYCRLAGVDGFARDLESYRHVCS